MNKEAYRKINTQIPFNALIPFLIISFGLSWGILGMFIVLPEKMNIIFGKLTGQHPLFFVCVYAPAIAAFAIVSYYGKTKGLKAFLSRFLIWRCSLLWYVFLFIIVPLIFIIGSYLKESLFTYKFPFSSIRATTVILFLSAIKGPIEEFGWRGLAVPLLQRKIAPIWTGIIIGIIWGIWHLPAFYLSGTQQSNWAFTPFFIGCIAISIIVNLLFNSSNGSILLVALFHFNLMNPLFPDAAPYDTYLLSIAAILMVCFKHKVMFSKKDTITNVIP